MGKKCSLIFIHKSNSISTWIDISSVKKWINSALNYEFKTIGLFEVCSNQLLSIKDLKWQDDFFGTLDSFTWLQDYFMQGYLSFHLCYAYRSFEVYGWQSDILMLI